MGWLEPITNRHLLEYQNIVDYNRVESNTKYLLDLLQSLGYLENIIQNNKTDWSVGDIDTLQQHLRIINNINQVEFISLSELKTLRTDLDINPPTSQDYNDWEYNLNIIYNYAISTKAGLRHLSFTLGGDKFGT
jgi:hypothetical protein